MTSSQQADNGALGVSDYTMDSWKQEHNLPSLQPFADFSSLW